MKPIINGIGRQIKAIKDKNILSHCFSIMLNIQVIKIIIPNKIANCTEILSFFILHN